MANTMIIIKMTDFKSSVRVNPIVAVCFIILIFGRQRYNSKLFGMLRSLNTRDPVDHLPDINVLSAKPRNRADPDAC